ncbi:hypothetical protein [Streptomyces sp. NPDC101206]
MRWTRPARRAMEDVDAVGVVTLDGIHMPDVVLADVEAAAGVVLGLERS